MRRFLVLIAAGLVAAGSPGLCQQALPLEEAMGKAAVQDKYRMLLRQISVPDDFGGYGQFRDYGLYSGSSYAGFEGLPDGHWVYVYPYWYIWRDLTAEPKAPREWGPEQATGMPDTAEAGDYATAWASREADAGEEWLLLEYPEAVVPTAVRIHETFNPGAVVKVSVFKLNGDEEVAWAGKDPVEAADGRGIARIPLPVDFKARRLKIYLDSAAVPGWNEIDAVELIDGQGRSHWAASAAASSTFAEPESARLRFTPAEPAPEPTNERLQRLEQEIRLLRQEIRALIEALQPARPQPPAPQPPAAEAPAAALFREYLFKRSLKEASGRGPDLQALNGTVGDGVYNFAAGNGLHVEDIGVSDHYTIELTFRFDDVEGWQKVLDFKKREADAGLYIYNGQLQFYSDAIGGAFKPATSHRVRLDRDRTTKRVRGFIDDVTAFEFIDSADEAVFDNRMGYFFVDDSGTESETSGGDVTRIRIWNVPGMK